MCNNSTCHQCNQPPLCAPNDCSCPVKDLSTDCVLYTGNDLACSGIKSQTILTELIQQLDEFICIKVGEITQTLFLINIGTGADVYKGVDLLGRKEIRRINAVGDLVTVTQNINDISVSIDEDALIDFITNELPDPTCLTSDDESINIEQQVNDCFDFSVNFRGVENVGGGIGVYKTFNPTTNNEQFKTIKSNSLSITENLLNTEISIEIPDSAQIPALYVNNLYLPTYAEWLDAGGNLISNPTFEYKGIGTLAKPFTDTIRYTSINTYVITPNTSIQNALDVYVGDISIYSKANPQKSGQRITVQKNNSFYTFPGDFNYNFLNLLLEESVVCTTGGWLLDMDDLTVFPSDSESVSIKVEDEAFLQLVDCLGFNNSGNSSTVPPAYDSGKICYLSGEGTIYSNYNGGNVLSRYLLNSQGGNNDGNLHFQVRCKLRADFQGVYLTKNFCRIDFYNLISSSGFLGSVNTNLQAFRMEGGQVRLYDRAAISVGGEVSSRTYGITFEPQDDGIGYTIFLLNSSTVGYACRYVFAKLNNEYVDFTAIGSKGDGATIFPFGSGIFVNGLFENVGATPWGVVFRDCSYNYTGIDFTKVDLTQGNNTSSINTIGSSIVETLVVYNNRANAIAFGRPLYSAFLNRGNPGVGEGSQTNPYPLTSTWYRDIVLPA